MDNGSTDGTAEAISIRFPTVRVLRLEENRGFTGGIMHAVANSWAPYAAFLNNDAVPDTGWLRALVDAIRTAQDDVIAIGGRITDPGGELADFVGGVMTFDGHGFQPGFRKPLGAVEEPDDRAEIFFACGGNMIVKRRPFIEIGGFDDDFFAYLEDVDFGWRAWLSGWRILYSRDASVRHKSSATSERFGNFERGVLFERNAIQTVIKNFDDDHFTRLSGSLFLTLLHRLHRYVLDRNEGTESLRAPFRGIERRGNEPTMLQRLARKLLGRPAGIRISDDLSRMQFRAIEWLFQNEDRLIAKRETVQSRRRRPDREILERFPLCYVPTYHGDEALMNSALFRLLRPDVSSVDRKLEEIIGR